MDQTVQKKQTIIDVQMTDELKVLLSSFSPITVEASFKYVPKVFRQKDDKGEYIIPKQFWPVFTLRELTGKEKLETDPSRINKKGDVEYNMSASFITTVMLGLISWKNWYDLKSGKEITFEKGYRHNDELTDEALAVIPEPLYIELYNAIDKRSTLSEEEEQGL